MSDATTGKPVLPSSLGGLHLTSLLPDGSVNPAALNIEFDIPVVNYTPGAQNKEAFLRVWGLGLRDISAALDLTPKNNSVNVKISAGMSKGLPLAKPGQQGLIMSGSIFQAWGNWVGTDQTLDLRFAPLGAPGGIVKPGVAVFPFTWQKGTQLSTAIAQTLSTAFPNQKQIISISSRLVLNHDEFGIYKSLQEFTNFINEVTRPIIGGNYPGVQITSNGQTVLVFDTTKPSTTPVKKIAFEDMIGQPTWIAPQQITTKLVLRGDLNIQDTITLPPSLATITQQSFLNFQDKSAFSGDFLITEIEHYGNFRQPDAESWNTTIVASQKLKAETAIDPLQFEP